MRLKTLSRFVVFCLSIIHPYQLLNCQEVSDTSVTDASGATAGENCTPQLEIASESVLGNKTIIDYDQDENLIVETKGASLESVSKLSGKTQVVASIDSNEAVISASKQSQLQPTKTYYAKDSIGTLHSSLISLDTARKKAGYNPASLYSSILEHSIFALNFPMQRKMVV